MQRILPSLLLEGKGRGDGKATAFFPDARVSAEEGKAAERLRPKPLGIARHAAGV